MSLLLSQSLEYLTGGSAPNLKVQSVRCLVLCFINLSLVLLGGIIFQAIEGSHELTYKCGVKRVHRDFIDSLWNETTVLSETDWKSTARHKLMAFEDELHEAVEAGVYSYSGQKSWTLSNSLLYSFSVMSTMGFGSLSCSTRLCKLITCVLIIIGVPNFFLFVTELARLFLIFSKINVKEDFHWSIDQSFLLTIGSLSGITSLVCFLNPLDSIYMVLGAISTNGLTDLQSQDTFIMILLSGFIASAIAIFSLFSISAQMRLREILNGFLQKYRINCME
eukprot:TRINITY_DN5696_c0_g1_i1.p1 TRINITY_DN5696_c0_g1~~TRINITY_DN5696_c0_g1_i1.p1  ORF type:complete len:278 (-),score=12.57 TRINITY_DN5696_c0_g1_i1:271-1104(-)